MLSEKDKGIILIITKHCNRILKKIEGKKEIDFYNDIDIREIVAFNLFQIGELCKKLSHDFVDSNSEIPWKQIAGLRDRIVHGYDSVDISIIWDTANISIVELLRYCEKITKT